MKEIKKKLYFNKLEFEKIRVLADNDPISGVEAYKNYIDKYPKDYSAYLYYISLLISVGNFKEAEELLDFIKSTYFTKQIYQKDLEKARLQRYNIHFCTIKLLAYQNRIEELLKYFYNNYDEIKELGPEIKFYYEKLMGKKYMGTRDMNSYLYRQMIEYQEEDFKDHIKKHMANFNENDSNISKSFFSYDFPINEVIEEVKKYIPSDKRLNTGFIQNTYVFKYDECGRVDNKLVDYFVVIVFNNTCEFITMCPSNNYRYYYSVDLNYMKEKKEDIVNTKVLSRIDKFNQRYKRNV